MNNKSGTIFNIVHDSFVDGYGVRTTIFLKGCPLRCVWCCNPEGQNSNPEIKFISLKMSQNDLNDIKHQLERYGLNVQIGG
jgi:pyruvate formate lyase activating enzyme